MPTILYKGSATGRAGGIATNLKNNSIMRIAPKLSGLTYTEAAPGGTEETFTPPPPNTNVLELKK